MTAGAVLWTFALTPGVEIEPGDNGARLCTAIGSTWVEGLGVLDMLELLRGAGSSEAQLCARRQLSEPDADAETRCAALLYRLDHLGLLARGLTSGERRLASSIPSRPPPPGALQERPPDGPLRLSARALARVDGHEWSVEAPGAWARMVFHDRDLLPILHDLATPRSAAEIVAAATRHSEDAILAMLALMSRCGLFDCDDDGWSGHDLLFHTRTRGGYARVLLGKRDAGDATPDEPAPNASDDTRRITLKAPDLTRLLAEDPPHALVSERRQSIRRQGSDPLTADQLSEFLFRTLHERMGRRPYPSGGGCYPLNAYLAVHRCRDVAPGVYAYSAARHDLVMVAEPGLGLERLLADAAAAANVAAPPQILLVLAADYARTQRIYGDLAYTLILKEVGVVFQTAMMAAAAMGIGTCPLGCGNSVLFADLLGTNPLVETSVGEIILGSVEEGI